MTRHLRRLIRRVWRLPIGEAILIVGGAGIGVAALETFVLERVDLELPARTADRVAASVEVVSITDGDTFRSTAGPVRIDNIEAPDSEAHPGRRTPECVDPVLAAQATAHLAAIIPPGTRVELEQTGTSYDRVVALVTVDGTDVGQAMLATGTVDTYPATGGPCPGADQ